MSKSVLLTSLLDFRSSRRTNLIGKNRSLLDLGICVCSKREKMATNGAATSGNGRRESLLSSEQIEELSSTFDSVSSDFCIYFGWVFLLEIRIGS